MIFIGATTENPSFELNNALLSRARICKLRPRVRRYRGRPAARPGGAAAPDCGGGGLPPSSSHARLTAMPAAPQPAGTGRGPGRGRPDYRQHPRRGAAGVAAPIRQGWRPFTTRSAPCTRRCAAVPRMPPCTGSVRMLDGGCDPLYIARRVVRMASEDIGNADPGTGLVPGRVAGAGAPGQSRGRTGDRPSHRLPGLRRQEQCRLQRLQRPHRADVEQGAAAKCHCIFAMPRPDCSRTWSTVRTIAMPTTEGGYAAGKIIFLKQMKDRTLLRTGRSWAESKIREKFKYPRTR